MYKLKDIRQQEFENFYLPFEGSLNPKNRWVKLAEIIPWEEFEQKYAEKLAGTGMGSPAKSFRIALGALIIKEKLCTLCNKCVIFCPSEALENEDE